MNARPHSISSRNGRPVGCAFVAVADHGNYGAAACALAVTQPALTKQIQALETRVGGTLFRRGRHGAEPTALRASAS